MANASTNIIGPLACTLDVLRGWVDEVLSSLGAEKIPHQHFRSSSSDQLVVMLDGEAGPYLLGPDARRLSRHVARLMAERTKTATRCANAQYDNLGDQLLLNAESIEPSGAHQPVELELPFEVVANYRQNERGDYGTRLDFTTQSGDLARFMARGMTGFRSPWNWAEAPFEELLGAWRAPKKLPPWPRVKTPRSKATPEQNVASAIKSLEAARTDARVASAVDRLRKAGAEPPLDPVLLAKGLVHPDDDARRWLLDRLDQCWFTTLGPAGLASLRSKVRCCELVSEDDTAARCRSLLGRINEA